MKKIKEIRKVSCRDTWSRYPKQFDIVQVLVADMIDGSRFYTTKDGTEIFGTSQNIDGNTDISDIHDFQSISVPGGVQNEEHFSRIVEKEAVLDQIC